MDESARIDKEHIKVIELVSDSMPELRFKIAKATDKQVFNLVKDVLRCNVVLSDVPFKSWLLPGAVAYLEPHSQSNWSPLTWNAITYLLSDDPNKKEYFIKNSFDDIIEYVRNCNHDLPDYVDVTDMNEVTEWCTGNNELFEDWFQNNVPTSRGKYVHDWISHAKWKHMYVYATSVNMKHFSSFYKGHDPEHILGEDVNHVKAILEQQHYKIRIEHRSGRVLPKTLYCYGNSLTEASLEVINQFLKEEYGRKLYPWEYVVNEINR